MLRSGKVCRGTVTCTARGATVCPPPPESSPVAFHPPPPAAKELSSEVKAPFGGLVCFTATAPPVEVR